MMDGLFFMRVNLGSGIGSCEVYGEVSKAFSVHRESTGSCFPFGSLFSGGGHNAVSLIGDVPLTHMLVFS